MESFDICMIVHNDVIHDGRILKEATTLARQGWKVVVLGITLTKLDLPEEETLNGFSIVRVTPRLFRGWFSGRFGLFLPLIFMFPAMSIKLRQINARVYHAHDFPAILQLALSAMLGRVFVYDSHELFFDRPLPDLPKPIEWLVKSLRILEKPIARRGRAFITVNDSIADILSDRLEIPRPVVLRNVVDTRDFSSPAVRFPTEPAHKVIVHSGNLMYGRSLPELVSALVHLPEDIVLVFLGKGVLKPALQQQAETLGVRHRVFFVEPVQPNEVSSTIAQAEMAVVLMSQDGKNNQLSLPNKLFEAVGAGIPLVTSPNVEIARLVEHYNMGVTCDNTDPRSIADAVLTILCGGYAEYKQNAQRARKALNWEVEEKKLIALYKEILD